jgi:actin-related protein 3
MKSIQYGENSDDDVLESDKHPIWTGLVINAGEKVTHILPVCDSHVINSCVEKIPLAGRDMTNFILQQLKDRGEKFPPEESDEIAAKIK